MVKHCWLRRMVVSIWSYLCVFSLGKVLSLHGDANVYWGWKYYGYNLTAVVLFGVTIWMLNRFLLREDKRLKVVSLIGGLLLAMAVVYGAYAHYVNDIFRSTAETFGQIGMMLGLLALTAPLMPEIFLWFFRGEEWLKSSPGFFKGHPGRYFVCIWMSIFVCYLPLFLAWWPGNFIYDAKYQLQNVIGNFHSTHHPLIHTWMMGAAYQFGQSVGDVSWGFQFYTLAQMLILSGAFAYMLLYLYKKRARTGIQVASWAFFALFPMNAIFSITSTKDVLCAAFFLYFMVFLVRYVFDKEKFKPVSYVGMITSGVFLALFRNNALYAVLVTAIILIAATKGFKEKGKIVLIFATIYLLAKLINGGLISYTNAMDKDSTRESMSVPLQCLARVAAYRKSELEPELYEEICLYIQEEDLASYNPYLSDPIKDHANETLLKSNLVNFFKLWVKVGLQFPDEYLESIVTNTLGYWYPLNQGVYVVSDVALYHTLIGMGEEIEKVCYCKWAEKLYASLFMSLEFRYTPVLGYAFRNVAYVWLIVVYLLWSFYKKNKERILAGMLPFVYLMTCFLGPLSALRYIYCLIVCVPLLLYLAMAQSRKE